MKNLYLVMEFMAGGDFAHLIEMYLWPSEYASKFYAAEMALGIEDMAGYRGI